MIDYDTAESMVKQLYPNAREPMLAIELNATKGNISYRPYVVYVKFLILEYRQVIKADDVTFAYNILQTARAALGMQASLDCNDTIPDECQSTDKLIEIIGGLECSLCQNGGTNQLGISLF